MSGSWDPADLRHFSDLDVINIVNNSDILNPLGMSFNIGLMVTQPDCSALIQNQADATNQGMTLDPNLAMAMAIAAMLFPQIMQQAGHTKNGYFQHVQTSPNSV